MKFLNKQQVIGDTVFNVLKLNDYQVDANERPLYPPKITSVEVIINPFDDIKPRDPSQIKCLQDKLKAKATSKDDRSQFKKK